MSVFLSVYFYPSTYQSSRQVLSFQYPTQASLLGTNDPPAAAFQISGTYWHLLLP